MTDSRRAVLGVMLVGVAIGTLAIISDLLGTVFFAITVAYVTAPYHRFLCDRGLPAWASATVATATAILGALVLFVPIGVILYIRRQQIITLIRSIPSEFPIPLFGYTYLVQVGDFTALAIQYLTRTAIQMARATPLLAAKALVFAFVVYALLARRNRLRRVLLEPVPDEYHDIAVALHDRVGSTLYALYIIQVATALGTFLIAAPIFWILGYQYPITLAVVAGILQFLPVVGPSLVIGTLALFEAGTGDPTQAAIVLVIGLLFIGFLPDAAIRPRLASETARLPASLYFIGFVGGVFTLGPVGIIAGPLVVVLLVELVTMFANEITPGPDPPGSDPS